MGLESVFRKKKVYLEPELAQERELLERGSRILASLGVHVLPYRDPNLPFLQSKRNPAAGIRYLQIYFNVLEEMIRDGMSPRDTPQFLWRYMTRIQMRPQPDIFGYLEDENVVEIYTLDNLQIFRNLRFFEFSSLTLEEVAHCDWSKVTRRSPWVTLKLLGIGVRAKAGLIRETLDTHYLGDNLTEETLGEKRSVFVQVRYISPLHEGQRTVAAVTVNRVRYAGVVADPVA